MIRIWSLGIGIAGCALGACGPAETTLFEDNPPLTPKGTDCALDPDCGEFMWRPQWFSASATFAVNPTGSTLRSYLEAGEVVLPNVEFRLEVDAIPDPCVVTFALENPEQIAVERWSWADPDPRASGQEMLHTAFEVPAQARATAQGCDWVDSLAFGDVAKNVSNARWGFGVGNMRTDVADLFDDNEVESAFLDAQYALGHVVGGSWSSDVWFPTTWASHAAIVSRLTEAGEHAVDGEGWPTDLIPAKELLGSADPVPGRYRVETVTLFDASFLSR